jgi:hypothetical protein
MSEQNTTTDHARMVLGGKTPWVSLMGARYSNDHLKAHPELIGRELIVGVDPENIMVLTCSTSSGKKLPDLMLLGKVGLKRTLPIAATIAGEKS